MGRKGAVTQAGQGGWGKKRRGGGCMCGPAAGARLAAHVAELGHVVAVDAHHLRRPQRICGLKEAVDMMGGAARPANRGGGLRGENEARIVRDERVCGAAA